MVWGFIKLWDCEGGTWRHCWWAARQKKKKKRGMELLSNVSPAQVAGAGGRFVQRREYKKSRPFVENEY